MDFIYALELQIVQSFGWSLYDIDRTDIESLLPFINYVMRQRRAPEAPRKARRTTIDQLLL